MKAQRLRNCGLALLLALIPLFSGCDQEQAHSAPANDQAADVNAGGPPADIVPGDTNNGVATTNNPDQDLSDASGTVISTPETSAPSTNNNPQLNDFVKLVQAGVGENVLLAYVTNSPGTFNLSSDDILYLNDLGAPDTVVSAMLQHDQQLTGNTAATVQQPQTTEAVPPTTEAATPPVAVQPDTDAYAEATAAAADAAEPPLTPPADIEDQVDQSPNTSYSYFYDSLAPYGNWIDISGYGPCWRPTAVAVNPGWTPYCDHGHWAYTDCGWCWVSDYSWGWAPFHYGRWFHNRHWGWCWAPDTVWGPAWVSWRYDNDYCGWAPLPPSACYRPGFGFTYFGRSVGFNFTFGLGVNNFIFVPLGHFHDRVPSRARVPHREVTKIFTGTTLNNQIIRGNNHSLINRGVPVDRVAAASHTTIRPIRVRADATNPGAPRLGRNGRSLSLFRPALPTPKPGAAPRRVGEGVQPNRDFNLQTRIERPQSMPRSITTQPTQPTERRPILSTPSTAGTRENPAPENQFSRRNNFSQPNTEKPGSLMMRGPNSGERRGQEFAPQTPSQPFAPAENNRRVVTPPVRPAPSQTFSPSSGRPETEMPRNDQRQQIIQQRQLQQAEQQQQLQQRQLQQREQRQEQLQQRQQFQQQQQLQQRQQQFQQPAPRQFEAPRENRSFTPEVRQQPIAPPRIMESRPAPEMRSAPQFSAPAPRQESGGGGRGGGDAGGSRGGGGGNNNNNNGGGRNR